MKERKNQWTHLSADQSEFSAQQAMGKRLRTIKEKKQKKKKSKQKYEENDGKALLIEFLAEYGCSHVCVCVCKCTHML